MHATSFFVFCRHLWPHIRALAPGPPALALIRLALHPEIHRPLSTFLADIWSLGLTLMQCATGEYPYLRNSGKTYWELMEVTPLPATRPHKISSSIGRQIVTLWVHTTSFLQPAPTKKNVMKMKEA